MLRKTLSYCLLVGFSMFLTACERSNTNDLEKAGSVPDTVLANVGGVDFDIPLHYFYDAYIWGGRHWPVPKKERTQWQLIDISAYTPGMKPWSEELNEEFEHMGDRLNILRITFYSLHRIDWLDRFISGKSLKPDPDAIKLPELQAYASDKDKLQIYYLPNKTIFPYPFLILHFKGDDPHPRYYQVTFTYKSDVMVEYLIPVTHLQQWRSIQDEVIQLLDSFTQPGRIKK